MKLLKIKNVFGNRNLYLSGRDLLHNSVELKKISDKYHKFDAWDVLLLLFLCVCTWKDGTSIKSVDKWSISFLRFWLGFFGKNGPQHRKDIGQMILFSIDMSKQKGFFHFSKIWIQPRYYILTYICMYSSFLFTHYSKLECSLGFIIANLISGYLVLQLWYLGFLGG